MKKIIKCIVFIVALLATAPVLHAQVSVNVGLSVRIAPPALPVYAQPVCPGDGFIWTPGYWSYGADGYYWVPGVWVRPPHVGVLWTPGYWGLGDGGIYVFHAGYWGPHVGFYGGINYGFGYSGTGFGGGRWAGNVYRYNTSVTNVNTTIVHNTYVNNTVINNNTNVNNRTSFNGRGGITRTPSSEEQSAMREHHLEATKQQFSHQENARQDRGQLAAVNNGRPGTIAMDKVNGRRFNEQNNHAAMDHEMARVHNGQMNPGEARRTENQPRNMSRNMHADRQVNARRSMMHEQRPFNLHQNRGEHQGAREHRG